MTYRHTLQRCWRILNSVMHRYQAYMKVVNVLTARGQFICLHQAHPFFYIPCVFGHVVLLPVVHDCWFCTRITVVQYWFYLNRVLGQFTRGSCARCNSGNSRTCIFVSLKSFQSKFILNVYSTHNLLCLNNNYVHFSYIEWIVCQNHQFIA